MMQANLCTRLIASTLTLALGGLLFSCRSSTEPKSNSSYSIGAIIFQTGDAAEYGKWVKNGLEMARSEINAAGGINGHPINLVYEDDRTNPQTAVTVFNKMISTQHFPVVIAGLTSSSTLAIAPIAERNRTVLFSPCSSAPALTNAGDYIFRNWPSDDVEGKLMAGYAYNKLKYRKIAILSINNDYGLGLQRVFAAEFQRLGGTIVSSELFPEGTADFRTIIVKLKQQRFDAIYMPSHAKEAGAFLKQLKENNALFKILGCVTFEAPDLLNIARGAAEGVVFTTPAFTADSSDPLVATFAKRYEQLYHEQPENFAAQSYDALQIIALAIRNAGYDATAVKNYLYTIKNYPGVSGLTTFDANGDVMKPALIKVVKDGRFVPVEFAK